MTKIKIPDQIFIVSKIVKECEYVEVNGAWTLQVIGEKNFGFLHPHEPNKSADNSRKKTQFEWAYDGEVYDNFGVWYHKGHVWQTYNNDPYGVSNKVYFDKPIETRVAPQVWDNVPMSGFRIIDTVNRYRGNKLFKVLDPRGIEFEITVKSLFEIISNGSVDKGYINSDCIWKANKHLMIA